MAEDIRTIRQKLQAATMEELPVLFLQYENDPRMGVQKEIERARRRKMDYDKELARTEALQEYEREYSAYAHICGIDEVGRVRWQVRWWPAR